MCVLGAAVLCAEAACIPVTVKTQHVEPTVSQKDLAADWNPWVAPKACRQVVDDVRNALHKSRPNLEFVDPDLLWSSVFASEAAPTDHRVRELVDRLNGGIADVLGLRVLVVLGPLVNQTYDAGEQPLGIFYASGKQESTLQAVVLRLGNGAAAPKLVQSHAEGIGREGWFPGYVLLFLRVYKDVDTQGGAYRGVAQSALDALPEDENEGAPRIAIIAESGCAGQSGTTPSAAP